VNWVAVPWYSLDAKAEQFAARLLKVAAQDHAHDGSVLAADGLELVPRAAPRDVEQRGLILRRRDPRDRADLRVRDLAAAQGVVEEWEVGEPIGDAQVFARGAEAPADAPG
jgi:hypothetical protein